MLTGDVVTAIDGVAVEDAVDFSRRIGNLGPGVEVVLTVIRDGEQMDLPVMLGTRPTAQQVAAVQPEAAAEEPTEYGLGLTVGEDRDGEVVVMRLNPVATAATAGLREGDVIIEIDEAPISEYADLQAAVESAREAGHTVMLFQIRRGDRVLFVPVDTWMYD